MRRSGPCCRIRRSVGSCACAAGRARRPRTGSRKCGRSARPDPARSAAASSSSQSTVVVVVPAGRPAAGRRAARRPRRAASGSRQATEKRAAPGVNWAGQRPGRRCPAPRTPRRPGCRARPGCGRARGAARSRADRASHVDRLAEQHHRGGDRAGRRAAGGSPGCPRSRGTASPSKSRGAAQRRRAGAATAGAAASLQRSRSPAAGHPDDPVGLDRAGVGVDHRVVARQRLGRRVGLGQHPPGPGQRDPQRELGDQRRPAPQRLDAGDVLAGQHQVDALRAAAPGQVLQQVDRLGGDRVPAGEQHLELVDHGDDPRPVPVRVLGAQLGQVGHLVPLGRVGPAAQLARRGSAAAPARTRGRC